MYLITITVSFSKKIFFSKLADFWYPGVFRHKKSVGASPEFQKNFLTPYRGYPMLKKINFFNFFILAPNWLIFGTRGFSGTSIDWRRSRVPKNFFWPPMGVPHVKKINFFNFFILASNWLIFGTRGFSGMRNRLAQVPSSKNQPIWS